MPGIEGLAMAPMMASVARVALSSSDSNQRSSRARAGPVRMSTASEAAEPRRRNDRPRVTSDQRSRTPGRRTFGGVAVIVGSMKAATRSSMASYEGKRAASRALNFEISRRLRSVSDPSRSERPSRNGVNDDGWRASTSNPYSARRRSRTISSRKRLLT